ncbi:MAG: right-handed parallel beta-helix repeat-containing protein [Methanothrix sp.]|jgi:parallel beta-helix repeat protein|nr:right-handed parallel beta-helix repeat-containing protein [Methanothrix sp.]
MANEQISSEGVEVIISYSHKDEMLRDELEKHLSILKRQKLISTWYDRKIGAGEEWKGQIDEHLDSARIILLLISADFLASDYCYDIELKRAMERHESGQACVIPIILRPVEWKGAPFGKLQALPTNAEPIVSKKWGCTDEAFVDVARGLRAAVGSLNPIIDPNKGKKIPEPSTIVVDQWQRGDFATISQAIDKADPGSRILITSGIYDEGLILDKPLKIVGDGNLGEVVIRAEGKNAILFRAAKGIVSNLVLQQVGGGDFYCVDIQQGVLELEGCDITGNSLACVAIHGKAFPKLRGNKIHDSKASGIHVRENGQGLIEGNDIFGNAKSGISIKEAGNPTVRGNKIHDGQYAGIYVYENGQGLIENNDIFGNALSGIEIREASNPTVRGNKIHDGKTGGINVHESGQGLIENNDIFGNALAGISIKESGNPIVRGNKIHDGKSAGIYVYENGQGMIEGNDIFGNALAGISIKEAGTPTVRGNRINKNGLSAVSVLEKGAGIIENNDLRDNEKGAWLISDDSKNLVKGSGNQE